MEAVSLPNVLAFGIRILHCQYKRENWSTEERAWLWKRIPPTGSLILLNLSDPENVCTFIALQRRIAGDSAQGGCERWERCPACPTLAQHFWWGKGLTQGAIWWYLHRTWCQVHW